MTLVERVEKDSSNRSTKGPKEKREKGEASRGMESILLRRERNNNN